MALRPEEFFVSCWPASLRQYLPYSPKSQPMPLQFLSFLVPLYGPWYLSFPRNDKGTEVRHNPNAIEIAKIEDLRTESCMQN